MCEFSMEPSVHLQGPRESQYLSPLCFPCQVEFSPPPRGGRSLFEEQSGIKALLFEKV